jgi:exosortase/archaeosortase family protein
MSKKKFVIKFVFFFTIFTLISNISIIEKISINFFLIFAKLFLLFFDPTSWTVIGNELVVNGSNLIMVKECTGLPMFVLFLAFALSYSKNVKKEYKNILLGVLFLVCLNVIRMFTIMIAAFIDIKVLNFVHDFLWPSTYFIFTLITVYFFIKRCDKSK